MLARNAFRFHYIQEGVGDEFENSIANLKSLKNEYKELERITD
jgi:hypothetical protein